MYLTYKPSGGEGESQEFIFIPGQCDNFDSEAIENATAWTWEEFLMNLRKGSVKARRALLWILLRRVHRGLQLRDVHFKNSEVELEYDKNEMQDLINGFRDQPEQPGMDKGSILEMMELEVQKARPAPDAEGKGQELIVAEGTPLPSHKSALTQ